MMVEGTRERGKACEVVMARRRQRGGLAREKAEELKSLVGWMEFQAA